jgi:hypothetical protein
MAISTQDCKDFISSITEIIGASSQDKWKRTRKYKENTLVFRDFENQDGRILTICEKDGKLSLYQLNSSPVVQSIEEGWGKKYIGREAKHEDVAAFLAEYISKDSDILDQSEPDEIKNDLKIAVKPNSWESWLTKYEGYAMTAEDWLENWGFGSDNCELYYADDNGEAIALDTENVERVFIFVMPHFDTAYRISVFETKDHCLYLGNNEPD